MSCNHLDDCIRCADVIDSLTAEVAAVREKRDWLQERYDQGRDVATSLTGDNKRLREALEGFASSTCCQTPGCCVDDPHCDTMTARQALAARQIETSEPENEDER